MRWLPRGYGGERQAPEDIKRDGWREQGVLVVSPADPRLSVLLHDEVGPTLLSRYLETVITVSAVVTILDPNSVAPVLDDERALPKSRLEAADEVFRLRHRN